MWKMFWKTERKKSIELSLSYFKFVFFHSYLSETILNFLSTIQAHAQVLLQLTAAGR